MAPSSRKKVLVLAGTRPEIIKMAPVVHALSRHARLEPLFCYSGQHRELAAPFLRFFGLEPQAELDLMRPGQSLGSLTARASSQIDEFLNTHGKTLSAVLVQGDTTTAFVGALIAFYHRLPVGHVEAGLRTSTIEEPFPEELNRRLITRVARWHFAPTEAACRSLRAEQVPEKDIFMTGNTGIDALLWARSRVVEPSLPELRQAAGRPLILVTAHRRENIGAPLERIVVALKDLAKRFPLHQFVLPVHKNPAVEAAIRGALSGIANMHLLPPLDYPDLVWCMDRCELILSDSGGIQEEAPSLRKPVLVLRNETERPEAVEFGTSILVGSDHDKIVGLAADFLEGRRKLTLPPGARSPFGDGTAAQQIADVLARGLG